MENLSFWKSYDMIELELKFEIKRFSPELDKFPLIKEIHQEDFYYDTKDYKLIREGNFLRVRNNQKIDFKLNVDDASHLFCKETSFQVADVKDKKQEINMVLKSIGLPHDQEFDNFDDFIKANDLILLSPIIKDRKVYKINDNLKISIDRAKDIGFFLEAERMIDAENITEEQGLEYKKEMLKTLKENNILSDDDEMVKIGYVELYLEKNNPKVYEMGLYKR